jgi:predicted hotdog family 3-hydroxylacyl-ACP dehydratase
MPVDPRILDLIPHAGSMCLLERILRWDDSTVVTGTQTHRALTNPLRSGGRLHAVHLCEYGAQAMAIHGGLLAAGLSEPARPGLLVTLRDVQLLRGTIDDLDGELQVSATRLHASASVWQYSFEVTHAQQTVAHGLAMVAISSSRRA